MRFDVFCIVWIYNVPGGVEIARATCTDCLVTEHPVVFAITPRRQTILPFFKNPHHEVDGVTGDRHERYTIDIGTSESLLRRES
jgi:hypothetical protein